MTARVPTRVLIAALGGEGGGVLVDWITRAAVIAGHWATRTSIPGVAQRTGATAYYVEVLPKAPGDPEPVLGLNAAPGRVDVLLSTELLEAARRAEAGFVTRDRTLAIVAHRRAYTLAEKVAAGDGRLPDAALAEAIRGTAREARVADYDALARRAGSSLNAVLLGALAASRALPIPDEAFRDAIRAGKAADANLRGFEAGLSGEAPEPRAERVEPVAAEDDFSWLPEAARPLAAAGVARLREYQNDALAARYVALLREFAPISDALAVSMARHLALRMSSEDVIRVAQLKLAAARAPRLVKESRARPGDIVHVVEFMKPGPTEILSLFPPVLARPLLRFVERRGWQDEALALNVSPTKPLGFLRLRVLAGLRWWRPFTHKHAEDRAWLERWLDLVRRTAATDPAAAVEVAETARLVKGYAATDSRGRAAWARVADEVIVPALAGQPPPGGLADALVQCRVAAQKNPEGGALEAVLAALAARRAERAAA